MRVGPFSPARSTAWHDFVERVGWPPAPDRGYVDCRSLPPIGHLDHPIWTRPATQLEAARDYVDHGLDEFYVAPIGRTRKHDQPNTREILPNLR